MYWVADDAHLLDRPDVPGVEGVVEYIYTGTAEYVGGVAGRQQPGTTESLAEPLLRRGSS